MKSKIFKTEEVRAILDGRKTMFRELIKKLPKGTYEIEYNYETNNYEAVWGNSEHGYFADGYTEISPHYKVEDILYIRETWCNINKPNIKPEYYYLADALDCEDYDPSEWNWSSLVTMPREAARLFLQIMNVKAVKDSEWYFEYDFKVIDKPEATK